MITTGLLLSMTVAFVLADPQPAPELLPQAPADWRFERIDFPLSFAPELPYQGFEELRFAPGMFKPETETYFTYVFAMKITGEAAFDAASLQSLLETYFRGLCRAVAQDKKLELDLSKISAQVKDEQGSAPSVRHFVAKVESFDPFVTGKPLTLNLEMMVIEVNKTDRRIFAAVSPKPADSPVWKPLRTLKDEFRDRCAKEPK